jgi:hypothetical protein
MNIKNISGMGPPKNIEKQSIEDSRPGQKVEKERAGDSSDASVKSDQVQISAEAKKLHKSSDELGLAKESLNRLPAIRAHVVFEALAKIKAGFYSSDEMVEKAAQKLVDSGELNDLLEP